MRENDKKTMNPAKARGSRVAPVIELSAQEIGETPAQPTAETMASQTGADTRVTIEETIVETHGTARKDAPSMETSANEEPLLASDQSPLPPPPQRSLFAPMAVAAVIGGLLGTAGGTLLPSLFGSGPTISPAEILRLRQQVSALEVKSAEPGADALRQRMQTLEAELAKKLVDAETRLATRVAGAEVAVKELAARPAGASAAPVDLAPLTQRMGALERDIKTIDGKTEAGLKAADPKIAAMAQQIEQATKQMAAANAAPFFSAVQGLAQAFQSGQPFATELSAVELLGGKPDALAPMRGLADKGAPTLQQIATGFAPFANGLAQTDAKSDSFAWSLVQKFAKVRPVGQVGGSSPPDLVTTVEAALAKGDISTALQAWRRLPELSRGPSTDWANAAEARDKAAKALVTIQDAAISALRMAKP